MIRSTSRRVAGALVLAAGLAVGAAQLSAQAQPQTPPDSPLSALAPANLAKPRPAAPFNLTGNWFIDNSPGIQGWLFGPATIPKLTPEAQKHRDAYVQAIKEGKVYRDDIGQCWPAGVPIIMTRVWPIAMIQLPTAIYMISEFMNSLRVVYLDGRSHTDPDIVVRTFNGESIGRWEGDTLVVETKNFIERPASLGRSGRAGERRAPDHRADPDDQRRQVARDRDDADRSQELGRRVEGHAPLESRGRPRHRGSRVPARPERASAEHVVQGSCSIAGTGRGAGRRSR